MYSVESDISKNILEGEQSFFNDCFFYENIEDKMKGEKLGVVMDIKDNFNIEVYINELNLTVIAPVLYSNSLPFNVGDTVLVFVDNLLSYKVLAVHTKTQDYILDKRSEIKLQNGNSELLLGAEGISMAFNDRNTVFTFKENGVRVTSADTLSVTFGNRMYVYFNELNLQGNFFDVVTGSFTSAFLPTILFNNGISLRSFLGDINIVSTLGNTNIFSGTFTNVGSLVMTNIISTGLVNITAPLIPNLTIGFFAPLLPSPAGVVGFKDLFANLVSPLKMPLPSAGDDFLKKIRQFIPL